MNNIIWDKWIEDWNWALSVSKKRQWDFEPLIIKPKTYISEINQLEDTLGIIYPTDFKTILTNYSSGVFFSWQINDEKMEDEFRQIFCGCGGVSEYKYNSYIWNFEDLEKLYLSYKNWLIDCYDDPTNWYGKHYYNKIPFIEVPNGDFIVFDTIGQVIYLSHDDGHLHGQCLAENFVEFISLWSNLGCVGTESWQFVVFYDDDKQKFMDESPIVERWKNWMNK